MTWMARGILDVLDHQGGAFLHEILAVIGSTAMGDQAIALASHPSVLLWTGVSQEFVDAFSEVYDQLEIRRADPSMIAFFSDDLGFPKLPVVSARACAAGELDYDHPRWLPVLLFKKTEPPTEGR